MPSVLCPGREQRDLPPTNRAHAIRIIVRQGDVTLSGVVNSRLEKQLARHLALHAFGVLTVTNDLRVEGEATD